MAEHLVLEKGDKATIYASLIPQIKGLVEGETNRIANLANVSAALKEAFDFLWVGFYLVEGEELVLGPFQGPIACTRIRYGKGVCGSAWEQGTTIVVDDVDAFPGHIACSSLSKSEIVVPLVRDGVVFGVLDVDSIDMATFDHTDDRYLTELCTWLSSVI